MQLWILCLDLLITNCAMSNMRNLLPKTSTAAVDIISPVASGSSDFYFSENCVGSTDAFQCGGARARSTHLVLRLNKTTKKIYLLS